MSRASNAPILNYYRRPWRRVPRPIWSAWWVTLLTVVYAVAVGVPTFLERDWPLLVRWEFTIGALAVGLWTMLWIGLYRGVRVRKEEATPKVDFGSTSSSADGSGGWDFGGFDGVDDPISGVVAIVLWIVFGLVLVLFAPFILEGILAGLVLLIAALAWITRRALRQVFIRGPRCRGRLTPSIGYATLYTALYVGWLLAALGIAHALRT